MVSRPGPAVGVLALQGDVREHLRALTACGARAFPVRRPEELDGVDGVVVPGGESTTMGKLAATFGLLEPLRDAIMRGLPAYGSCAGMIMLADTVVDSASDQQTLGGIDMVVRRNAFGRQVDSFEGDVALDGIDGPPFHAVFIRAPWVEETGPGVEVLARVESGPGAGKIVAVRQGNLLATSFHPELTADLRLHRLFLALVRDAVPLPELVLNRQGWTERSRAERPRAEELDPPKASYRPQGRSAASGAVSRNASLRASGTTKETPRGRPPRGSQTNAEEAKR